MKARSGYTLQRTMIIYLLLIGFASLLVGVAFVVDTYGSEFEKELYSDINENPNNKARIDEIPSPIDRLRNKAILMVGIIMFVMIIILTMFIKNITEPLQHMVETSKEISKGDLSQTIRIHSNNELAELGSTINELSSNLQEIIQLSKNVCSSGKFFITKTSGIVSQQNLSLQDITRLKNEVTRLKGELSLLDEVIEYFNFYSVEK